MKTTNFTFKAIVLAALFWLFESLIHRLVFSEHEFELFPSEVNELWMRFVIMVLVISFGIYADFQTKKLLDKEKEKRLIFKATVNSSQHIINNLLNQMQYFRMEIAKSSIDKTDLTGLFDQSLKEGQDLMELLSSVEELTERNIRLSVSPK